MKKVNLPRNASITVSRDAWKQANERGIGGWGWAIVILFFIAVAYGSTDGTETPDTSTPDVTVTATYAP